MAKRCKNCYYIVGDMCSYWRIWRKDIHLPSCSEAFVKELDATKAVTRKAVIIPNKRGFTGFPELIIDKEQLKIILTKHFPVK